MWNRVVLLVAGFAFGWNLVHTWTAPDSRLPAIRLRLLLSAGVGLALLAFLNSFEAVLVGALVFGFSALVAYAANAKQVNRIETPPWLPRRPERPLEAEAGRAVLLVTEGEPLVYDGPRPWAYRFQAEQAAGRSVPHWFMRPHSYARIRAAYRQMGNNALHTALVALARDLEAALASEGEPRYHVESAYLFIEPDVAHQVYHLAEQGYRTLVLLPVGLAHDPMERLREQVTQARVREIGVHVSYASPLEPECWAPAQYPEHFRALLRGEPPALPVPAGPAVIDALCQRVRTSAGAAASEPPPRYV